jgi:hypothetical protein
MDPLDEQTLDGLADLICGEPGPVYRTASELSRFFHSAGVECPDFPPGSTRKWWTLARLREYNHLPQGMRKVILRLADPREYKGNAEATQTALEHLNNLLAIEGLQIQLSTVTPQIVTKQPTMAAGPEKASVPLHPPDFSTLTGDRSLADILAERWAEAQKCVDAGAHCAALVMMGSLLEGALLAVVRANAEELSCSKACPRDPCGKPKAFGQWKLHSLIDVARECGWIQRDRKGFVDALRNYRNIVHPWHQLRAELNPDRGTCDICWQVVRAALNDLAKSRERRGA